MAQSTTSQHTEKPQQAPTPGVGTTPGSVTGMGQAPTGVMQTPETRPAEPVLFDDIEPIYLMRLYPHAKDPRAAALEAGKAAAEAAMHSVADQQNPIAVPEGAGYIVGSAFAPQRGR